MCRAHHKVEDFAQAIRAIGEPIHARTADRDFDGALLTLLFEVTALFDMTTRTELVLLQKTMVVVEGVARRLDPKLDMWSTAEPVVRDWITDNLGPKAKIEDAGRSLTEIARLATHLPKVLADAENALALLGRQAAQGVDLSPASLEELARARRRSDRSLLVGIAAILAAALWLFRR